VARTIKGDRSGILRWFVSEISQRRSRRDQRPGSGRSNPGTWLPQNKQLHHHGLPHRWKNDIYKVGIHLAPAIMHRRNRFINAGGILHKIPIRERIQLDGLLHESEKKKSAV
jgi:hypothetical protein